MRRAKVVALVALAALGVLASVGSAQAAPGDPFQYKGSFAIPGVENPSHIAVNYQSGNVLVFSQGQIKQFDLEGNPVDFSGLGSPSISVGGGQAMYVDNSGGSTQGNIYVLSFLELGPYTGGEQWWAFAPDGTPVGSNPHIVPETGSGPWGITGGGPAPDGKVWLLTSSHFNGTINAVRPFNPDGTPSAAEQAFLGGQVARLYGGVFDGVGDYYALGAGGTYHKFDGKNGFADLGGTGLQGDTGIPYGGNVATESTTNDLYTRQGSKVLGVHYSDPLVSSAPFEALSGVSNGGGPIAFDDSERVYISESSRVSVFRREPPSPPFALGTVGVDQIRSDRAQLHGQLAAGGAPATFHYEFGTDTSYGQSTPDTQVPFSLFPVARLDVALEGLQRNTTYHVRMVATNSVGTTYGPDRVFRTYPISPGDLNDPCPNALARKQTGAQRLPDCRAYELASAADTAGYDVESYLAPGQVPFGGFPYAKDRLLYAIHAGAVPGPWNATNNGPDPYLATRTAGGWVTDYKGLPADINPAADSFSSVLGEADSRLDTFAFAGANLCSPCFGSGIETGIPVRMSDGRLVQGMAGSLAPGAASAKPEGKVAKYFSKDGKRLVFASKFAFEPGANAGGDLTVYARDLAAGSTEIVSTDPSGVVLTGEGISELDISNNGSRVLVGKRVSVDSVGNEYVHPYLHIAGRAGSVDLAPLSTSGVLYAGMSEDGSKVLFTSADKLVGSDTDESADLYEASVDGSGTLSLAKITPASSDVCNPVANSSGAHWNTTDSSANCGAVAISGGGGVASGTGAIYFLSPESFGGEGAPDQPNLYVARPGGPPVLVATLEPDNPLLLDSVKANATRKTGDFQTTPNGRFAVFTSVLKLTGVPHFGLRNVFEFDADGGEVTCPSCDLTGTTDASLADDVELAPNGLSLLDDGRVFFTTRFPLVLHDANGRKDVYEWSEGKAQLVSGGLGPFDSALLTASADGTDVFFFTHEALAPKEDQNGQLMKLYDARVGGGFFKLPAEVPCKASDECHGPGTAVPSPPDIKSSGKTTSGNAISCAKNRVKRRGKCVKKAQPRKKKAAKHKKKRAAKTGGKRGGRNA